MNEEVLIDRDYDIFKPTLSNFDPDEIQKLSSERYQDSHDYHHLLESNLAKLVVPKTYRFPEFLSWCTQNYVSLKKTIMSSYGLKILLVIDAKSFVDMISLLQKSDYKTLK